MKQMSAERKAHIKASLAWQQFSRDADEVSDIVLCITCNTSALYSVLVP